MGDKIFHGDAKSAGGAVDCASPRMNCGLQKNFAAIMQSGQQILDAKTKGSGAEADPTEIQNDAIEVIDKSQVMIKQMSAIIDKAKELRTKLEKAEDLVAWISPDMSDQTVLQKVESASEAAM